MAYSTGCYRIERPAMGSSHVLVTMTTGPKGGLGLGAQATLYMENRPGNKSTP